MIPLNQIHVPEPCGQDWEAMDGDAQKRLCAGCGCHVHDLSAMTAKDAQSVLDNAVGRLCVRYQARPDGTPLTLEDAPAPERRVFWTRRLAAAASWALALAVTGLGLTDRTEAAPQQMAHAKSKPHVKLKPHAVPVVPQRPHRFLGRVVHRHPVKSTDSGQGQPTVAPPTPPPNVVMGAPPPLQPPTTMTGESGGSPKK